MYDQAQAQAEINEAHKTIDQLRKGLANEQQIADQLRYALVELMRDYVKKELDPRTDDIINEAVSAWRQARNTYITER